MQEAATYRNKLLALMRSAENLLSDRSIPAGLRQSVTDLRTALRRTWSELADEAGLEKELEQAMELDEAKTKTVGGKSYPASDFLVVEDPDKPTSWHLQVKRNGTPDHNLMGAAWAALHGGYRGNKYGGPDKAKAVSKLKALYKSEDMEVPAGEAQAVEVKESAMTFAALLASRQTQEAIRACQELTHQFGLLADNILFGLPDGQDQLGALRALADEYIGLVETLLAPVGVEQTSAVTEQTPEEADNEQDAEPQELAEAWSDEMPVSVVGLEEADGDDGNPVLYVDIVPIQPGWGNKRDNHYYPAEVVENAAPRWVGAKMYASDHDPKQKSVLTEVSEIVESPVGKTAEGVPIARAVVFHPTFEEILRKRSSAGRLESLHCSILASGKAKPGFELDGRKGKLVTEITEAESVDWVTRAGAGGHALSLVENAEGNMEKDQELEVLEDVQEADTPETDVTIQEANDEQDAEPIEPASLDESEVQQVLGESNLPDISRAKLATGQYADLVALEEAIETELAYVTELTGAGRPVGQAAKPASQEPSYDLSEALDDIDRRYGLKD